MAKVYKACAVEEHRNVEVHNQGTSINPNLATILHHLVEAGEGSELYSFRVPVSVNEDLQILFLTIIPQRQKTEYFASYIGDLKKSENCAGWVEEVFTLKHLPGWVFVLCSGEHIHSLRKKRGIPSQPLLIPHTEWGAGAHSSLFLPWVVQIIHEGSWVKISKPNVPYFGELAYVVGSVKDTNIIIIAVVPRICQTPHPEESMEKEAEETGKPKGKGRKTYKKSIGKTSTFPTALFDPETTEHGNHPGILISHIYFSVKPAMGCKCCGMSR
jgi:hypothetical protein